MITPIIIPMHRSSSDIPMTAEQAKFTIIFFIVCLFLLNAISVLKWILKIEDDLVEFVFIGTIIIDSIVLFSLIAFYITKLLLAAV